MDVTILNFEPKQQINPLQIWFKNPEIIWQYQAMTLNIGLYTVS